MHRIVKEKNVFTGNLLIEEGQIEATTKTGKTDSYSRLRLNRQDAAAVFIYNEETNKVILTRQFRYAIAAKVKEPILEIVAGKVDPGEEPRETAIRESEEESGYRIRPEKLEHLASFFASPGYSSEKYHLYFALVTNSDKRTEGGGLAVEHESIELVEMTLVEFGDWVRSGRIEDAKTLVAALMLKDKPLFQNG